MDLGLDGRVIIVTGGTTGLGRATAEVLVAEGARVIVASRDQGNVDATVDVLGSHVAAGVAADITDPITPRRLLAAADDHFGRVDGLFLSHGGPRPGPAAEVSDDDLEHALALATAGPIRLLRDIGAVLEPGGAMVALTSSSSVQPIAGLATSNITRPAVWGYAKSLADELAPRGVRVNVLLPGRFATDRVAALEERQASDRGITPADIRAEFESSLPLRRLGDPLELGRVAAFLLSPAASYVTGAAWAVDGGVIRGL